MENRSSLTSAPLCNQCGSKLIRVTKKTKKIEGQRFPITIITYRCSDPQCQKRIDKERRERLRKEKERAQKKQPQITIKPSMPLSKKVKSKKKTLTKAKPSGQKKSPKLSKKTKKK